MIFVKAIQIFLSLCWHQPDLHLPEKYRQGRISFMTALEVAASWYNTQMEKQNGR